MAWLSILIPVYNSENYIEDCLRSVVTQLDDDIELIILDDASTDKSLHIIKSVLSKNDQCVRLIELNENFGISEARNRLLTEATGDYVWFLDSDDSFYDGVIYELKKLLESNKPDWVICDYSIASEQSKYTERCDGVNVSSLKCKANVMQFNAEELVAGMFFSGKLHIWSKIIKRDMWCDSLRFPRGKVYEDVTLVPKMGARVSCFYYVPKPWVAYRKRNESIVNHFAIKKTHDMVMALDGMSDELSKVFPRMSKKLKFSFILYCSRVYVNAIKMYQKNGTLDETVRLNYENIFYRISGCNKREIVFCFLRFGQVFRLTRLLRYLKPIKKPYL